MAPGRGRATREGIAPWLLPAALSHAALVVLAAALAPWMGARPERAAPALRAPDSDASIELLVEAAVPVPARPPMPIDEARRSANAPGRAERVAVAAPRRRAERSGAEPQTGAEEPGPFAGAESPRGPAPTLSLEQLGVGAPAFLSLSIPPPTREEQVNARLYAAMHPPAAGGERQRGVAGAVSDAARGVLLADDGLAETNAVFNVSVDGSGHVSEVHVLDASNQVKAWQLLAARLAKALEPMKLPPDSHHGWTMKLRLASTVQLPSGAAPGLRVGALGKQLAGGGGPGSTSLELSPTSKLDLKDPIDNIGHHMEATIIAEVMLLKLKADPADIGAAARRVVQVAVLSIEPLTH